MVCLSESPRGLNFRDVINVLRYFNEEINHQTFLQMNRTDYKGLFTLIDVAVAMAHTYVNRRLSC